MVSPKAGGTGGGGLRAEGATVLHRLCPVSDVTCWRRTHSLLVLIHFTTDHSCLSLHGDGGGVGCSVTPHGVVQSSVVQRRVVTQFSIVERSVVELCVA